jgi:hypothetical protein
MSMSPLTHFFGCEVSYLVKSNAICNTMMVDKLFCKSSDDSFHRIITFIKDSSIPKISVYSSKDIGLSLPRWKPSNVVNLSSGH